MIILRRPCGFQAVNLWCPLIFTWSHVLTTWFSCDFLILSIWFSCNHHMPAIWFLHNHFVTATWFSRDCHIPATCFSCNHHMPGMWFCLNHYVLTTWYHSMIMCWACNDYVSFTCSPLIFTLSAHASLLIFPSSLCQPPDFHAIFRYLPHDFHMIISFQSGDFQNFINTSLKLIHYHVQVMWFQAIITRGHVIFIRL